MLLSLTEDVRVPVAHDLEMLLGCCSCHKTWRRRTIFPRVHKDYSSTPLPKKLGIKEGLAGGAPGCPSGFAEVIGVKPRIRGQLDVIVLFETKKGELTRAFTPLARRLAPPAGSGSRGRRRAAEIGPT